MSGAALRCVLGTLGQLPTEGSLPVREVRLRTFLAAADLADRNGVYYPFIQAWLEKGGSLPPDVRARWAAEQANRARLANTVELLNQVQERTRVEYVVIKDAAVPGAVPRDVDVLVPSASNDAFVHGLAAEGFESVFDNEAEHSFAASKTLRVDVYNRIQYLGREFVPVDFLLSHRITKETHGIEHPGLDSSAGFLLNSIHGLLGHAAISLLDFLNLSALRDALPDLAPIRARAEASGWGRCFDRWVAYTDDLRRRVFDPHDAVRFPVRHGHRLIRACLADVDGWNGDGRGVLDLSLLWDDLVFYTEDSGLATMLRRSRIATAMANAAGHRLRILRGDRKAPERGEPSNLSGRTRTVFR